MGNEFLLNITTVFLTYKTKSPASQKRQIEAFSGSTDVKLSNFKRKTRWSQILIQISEITNQRDNFIKKGRRRNEMTDDRLIHPPDFGLDIFTVPISQSEVQMWHVREDFVSCC